MLKTCFIGNNSRFNQYLCDWLRKHTDLRLILWTNRLRWTYGSGIRKWRRVTGRFCQRAKKWGVLRTGDELLYFLLYETFLARSDAEGIRRLIRTRKGTDSIQIDDIKQIWVEDIRSSELAKEVEDSGVDAIFCMCIDVFIPKRLRNAARYGTFLWHEGITPEYRGVHSPFWALVNGDYQNLGYTLLKMNSKYDGGEIYLQGRVEEVDPLRDWHSYIGHKAVLDSLDEVEEFLKGLEGGWVVPLDRSGAPDRCYTYPTGTQLLRLWAKRMMARSKLRKTGRPAIVQRGLFDGSVGSTRDKRG